MPENRHVRVWIIAKSWRQSSWPSDFSKACRKPRDFNCELVRFAKTLWKTRSQLLLKEANYINIPRDTFSFVKTKQRANVEVRAHFGAGTHKRRRARGGNSGKERQDQRIFRAKVLHVCFRANEKNACCGNSETLALWTILLFGKRVFFYF